MFLRQLAFDGEWLSEPSNDCLEPCPTKSLASLPPYATALYLLRQYIAKTHVWWPLLHLPTLRQDLKDVYQNPRKCTDAQKFTVFAILALSSAESQGESVYGQLLDLNEPSAYFRTSLRYMDSLYDHPKHVFRVQALLLLGIWMLDSKDSGDCNDLWHLSRYAMSAAIQAGLHRHNASWKFSTEDLEIRNRTWWCTYNLER